MNAAMLMLVASTMTAPQPAATNDLSVSPSLTIGRNVTFVSTDSNLFQAAKPSPTHQMAGKTVTFFIQGGVLFCCDHAGFTLGGELAFVPMKDHQQFEVNADVNYMHIAGTNGWNLSFNGQYNFIMQNSKMKPFAGAGLIIASFNYGTNVAFQINGGIEAAMASGRAIRIQIKFAFTDATTTIILFGFAF